MATQNQSESKNPLLDEKMMEKIDTELFWMESTLTKIDHARMLMKDKAWFLESFEKLWDDYSDLLSSGTDPGRAKYIFMIKLRDTLEAKLTLEKGLAG